ncbi:MAG: hypothetical protein IPJ25_12700 [Rhodocyclaceae bacterium]|nr:hypothetical protein [Rhodocyclaceae bacterium]
MSACIDIREAGTQALHLNYRTTEDSASGGCDSGRLRLMTLMKALMKSKTVQVAYARRFTPETIDFQHLEDALWQLTRFELAKSW